MRRDKVELRLVQSVRILASYILHSGIQTGGHRAV